jgi:RHH-type proline utilization regulon transcriptional repressor/proline dehydrogenase/delta 1-pyrroline-5-carboxylate dehydrogenase
MGEELYAQIVGPGKVGLPCRVYAPVGSHEDLLPYLVRRLLENGANTSFVNRIVDEQTAIADIVRDPVAEVDALPQKAHTRIPAPRMLYGSSRLNSRGVNLPDPFESEQLTAGIASAVRERWTGGAIVSGKLRAARGVEARNPANRSEVIGTVSDADEAAIEAAFAASVRAQPDWDLTPASERA